MLNTLRPDSMILLDGKMTKSYTGQLPKWLGLQFAWTSLRTSAGVGTNVSPLVRTVSYSLVAEAAEPSGVVLHLEDVVFEVCKLDKLEKKTKKQCDSMKILTSVCRPEIRRVLQDSPMVPCIDLMCLFGLKVVTKLGHLDFTLVTSYQKV